MHPHSRVGASSSPVPEFIDAPAPPRGLRMQLIGAVYLLAEELDGALASDEVVVDDS